MIEISDFIGISIVGAALSTVIEMIKSKYAESYKTKVLTIVLSVVVGTIYVFVRQTTWWTTVIAILAAASTVYALFIKK